MNFFQKLLGFLTPSSSSPDKTFIKRASRVPLSALHNIHFQLEQKTQTKIELHNISTSGVGFFKPLATNLPQRSEPLRGFLFIKNEPYPVALKIIHETQNTLGCAFIAISADLQKAISKYFALELSALSLSQVKSEVLKPESDGIPHWFRGRDNCELFFVENQGKILRFHLSFFGNYVEGTDGQQPKFGCIVGDDFAEADKSSPEDIKLKHKGSSLIQLTSALSDEDIEEVQKFLAFIPDLSAEYRDAIKKSIKGV